MDGGSEKSISRMFLAALRRHFASGILVAVPVVVTVYVLYFLFQKVDGLLSPLLRQILGYSIPGMGLVATLALIVLAGILTHNVLGSRLYALSEILFIRTPLVRAIYGLIMYNAEAWRF